jgi:putative two-component system response regulator
VTPAIQLEIQTAPILVVDDERANVLLLQKALAREGYTDVRATSDPREVMALQAERPASLVLLDINMPHLDGFAILKMLMELPQDKPSVLMLTAQTMVDHKVRALTGGARDYLSKPFDIPELSARVRNLLEAHLFAHFLRHQNAVLEDRVAQRTAELQQSQRDVVRRLGRAAEYRDNETGLHTVRMSHFARILAEASGLSAPEVDLIFQAAPMHDIGKIGIPDHILLKPGKLEAAEWEIMKTHAAMGADVLDGSDTPLLKMAHEIALGHHEKWDGSGYPAGLAGEAIPLSARIVAVADVFDALTSARPYKEAWSVERATALLIDARDSHFEGRLVDAFLTGMGEVQLIRDRYAEPT